MTKVEEARIGGSKGMDIVARQWEGDDRIDCVIKERRMLTPEGELFEALLMKVAPEAVGKLPTHDIVKFCMVLSRQAREAMMIAPLSVSIPSQATLRRKIAKHKEKTNGSRP